MSTRNERLLPLVLLMVATTLLASHGAFAQAQPATARQVAELTGNDVYIRSGDSTNHYPVCKASAGTRLVVVGQKEEWYEVLPPDDAFCWISEFYVDTADNKDGVVNGNNVRVRAGSVLADFAKHRSWPVGMLDKGAEVTIVGASDDGWLKIKPPRGTTFWVSRQFVEIVPGQLLDLEEAARAPALRTTPPQSGTSTPEPGQPPATTEPVPTQPQTILDTVPQTEARTKLELIDADVRAELAKPVVERKLAPLMDRYRAIKEGDDEFARAYADRRIAQLQYMHDLIDSIRQMRGIKEEAESIRREHLNERARIRVQDGPLAGGFDAQGELRPSALYGSAVGPQRYRLVDPSTEPGRTIGYVEIPLGSGIRPQEYIGRYVGVRASEKKLLPGSVKAVPIYIAADLVVLAQPTAGDKEE